MKFLRTIPILASAILLSQIHASAVIIVLNEDQVGDYTFEGGNTYYITNSNPVWYDGTIVTIYGTATFEPGTVVKYGPVTTLALNAVDFETTSNNPAIFTARDDDTVGAILPDSQHVVDAYGWGTPYFANTLLEIDGTDTIVQHAQMRYAYYGVNYTGYGDWDILDDVDIRYCDEAINSVRNYIVENSRISHATLDGTGWGATFTNVIFNDVGMGDGGYDIEGVHFYNSILANVGIDGDTLGVADGISNGFYNVSYFDEGWYTGTPFSTNVFGSNYQFLDLHAPSAFAQTVQTTPNNSVDFTLTANSPDSKPLTYILLSSPTNGTLSGTPPDLTYMPNTDYLGPDSFTFTVDDGILDSTNATVSINVDGPVEFSISATNIDVNTNLVLMQLDISQGVPSYISVVDTNNFIPANATWDSFASTNILVFVGPTNGEHQIWIGLKSWSGLEIWHEITLTLDTKPPVLNITNPAVGGTVSVPFIQVQGLVNEELSSLTFDLSNALQVLTNQTGFTQDLFYDTNLLAYTTNSFQLYDVPLTNGVNSITIYATDLAGNVATTNFNVTLDYSGDTTPPALNIVWPQDGMEVAGDNFTMQAQIDDVTAKVTASINGQANAATIYGSGKVLVNNLSLAAGANTLTITATDAAGNSSTTNITVNRSAVSVSINPISGDQLNAATVNVSGTISDISQNLWVNGVAATVNSDGTWTASNVPVSEVDAANFQLQTYDSGNNLTGTQTTKQEQPPEINLSSYEFDNSYWLNIHQENLYTNEVYTNETSTNYVEVLLLAQDCWAPSIELDDTHWAKNVGGTEHYFGADPSGYCGDPSEQIEDYTSSAEPPFLEGGGEFTEQVTSDLRTDMDNNPGHPPSPEDWPWTFTVHERTKVELDAGEGEMGATKNYILLMFAEDEYGPLPPERFSIRGQQLTPTTITNEDGSGWGTMTITVPAGMKNLDVTATTTMPLDYYWYEMVAFNLPPPAVDNNRDGKITFDNADQTSSSNPFRFWVNDSAESGDIASGSDVQVPGSSTPNCNSSTVNGRSDVVNYFPVALNLGEILQELPPTNGYEYHLSQADSAVKFVYTSLAPNNAFSYLTDADSSGYGTNWDEALTNADTIAVTNSQATGTVLDGNWLAAVQASGGEGIILMEGCKTSTAPLELEVWYNGQKWADAPLQLSIGGVEQMFRHKNLRNGSDAPSGLSGDTSVRDSDPSVATSMGVPSNLPESNDRWFIFVVGSNVGGQSSRGWESEVFKRMYWSGSKANFVGVTWYGDPYGDGNDLVYDYHLAVRNAFATAPALASFVNGLSGNKTIAGHSLANGVIASAISDYSMSVNNACLVDAAFAQECFDGDADDNLTAMRPSAWEDYPEELWAAHWHELFDASDARSTLTWRNRFAGALTNANVYSFYSSTEDCLGEYDGTPTSALVHDAFEGLIGGDYAAYVWVLQEKCKGNKISLLGLAHVGSDYGGWGANVYDGLLTNYPVWYVFDPLEDNRQVKTPSDIGTVTTNLLEGSKYNPFFKSGWGTYNIYNPATNYVDTDPNHWTDPGPSWIINLYDATQGSATAATNNVQLLAEAIPALSLPVGANPCQNNNLSGKQFDMAAQFADVARWPREVPAGQLPKWWHSDMDQVAYPFIYGLYNQLVSISNQ